MRRVTAVLFALLALAASPAPADTVAIVGGRVLVGDGTVIEGGTVLFTDGRIVAVGVDVQIPEGAEVIDAEGLWVVPGMIDPYNSLGLIEVGSVQMTNDANEATRTSMPQLRAVDGINPDSALIAVGRRGGVTTVLVSQGISNPINGQAAIIDLAGRTVDQMLVDDYAALTMGFGRGSGRERSYPSTRIGIMAFVRQTLFDAVAFSDQQEKKAEEAEAEEGEEGSEPAAEKRDLVKEALLPVVRGQIPVIAAASNIQEIRNALAVAEEFELRLVLLNPSHAYKMLEEIKASGAAVLVGNTFRTPDENEPYDRYYSLAAELHRAGIEFAFTTGYPFGLRTLPCAASQSVAFGLPEEAAFEALTLAPARILGIDEDYGSLEAGKVANVVIWNGNPLQNRSSVLRLWIRGEEMDLQSRQEQLRDKFADVN